MENYAVKISHTGVDIAYDKIVSIPEALKRITSHLLKGEIVSIPGSNASFRLTDDILVVEKEQVILKKLNNN